MQEMHVGHIQEDFKCQDQLVDSWTEVEVTNMLQVRWI